MVHVWHSDGMIELRDRKKDIIIDTTTWNRRYREYMEKIKTGSVFEIAEVMRDLYVLKKTKTLSFGERKMLDTAQGLSSFRRRSSTV